MEGVNDLLARAEIANALGALANAQDAGDWAAVAGAFLPDATYEHPGGTLVGAVDIVARVERALGHLDSSQHLIGSIVIEVQGQTATSVALFQAEHVRAGAEGGEMYAIGGRYADRWVRTSDGWRIEHRTQTYQWRSGNREVVVPTTPGTGVER